MPLGIYERTSRQTRQEGVSVTGSLNDPCDDWSVAIGEGLLAPVVRVEIV